MNESSRDGYSFQPFQPTAKQVQDLINAAHSHPLGLEFLLDALRLRVKYELNNIANENYEAVSGYPMPLQNQSIRCDVVKNF